MSICVEIVAIVVIRGVIYEVVVIIGSRVVVIVVVIQVDAVVAVVGVVVIVVVVVAAILLGDIIASKYCKYMYKHEDEEEKTKSKDGRERVREITYYRVYSIGSIPFWNFSIIREINND